MSNWVSDINHKYIFKWCAFRCGYKTESKIKGLTCNVCSPPSTHILVDVGDKGGLVHAFIGGL